MIKYLGSQKKKTISISGNSSVVFAVASSLDQGVYRVYESTSPQDHVSIFWNGSNYTVISFPDSKFLRQNLSISDKFCFYIDNTNLMIKSNFSTSKTIITWLEN